MDNTELSLAHFGHLFELITGYYLLVGTEKFRDYFNISKIFSDSDRRRKKIDKIISTADEEAQSQVLIDRKFNSVEEKKNWLENELSGTNNFQENANKIVKLKKIAERLQMQLNIHFNKEPPKKNKDDEDEESKETQFYSFIKPYYLYFGVFSLTLLILGGIYTEWHRLISLDVINIISLAIFIVMLSQIIYCAKKCSKHLTLNPIYTFLISVIVLSLFLIFPTSVSYHFCFIPNYLSDRTTFNDTQIILSVILVLLPILTHIFVIFFSIIIPWRRVNYLISQLSTTRVQTVPETVNVPKL